MLVEAVNGIERRKGWIANAGFLGASIILSSIIIAKTTLSSAFTMIDGIVLFGGITVLAIASYKITKR